jgi:hypothetical protein
MGLQYRTLAEIRWVGFVGINLMVVLCLAAGWIVGGHVIGIRRGGWPDYSGAKCWRCAGDRNREFSRQCRRDGGHLCCDLPDGRICADCAMDGPILSSTSTRLRADA